MRHNLLPTKQLKNQQGSMLVIALFILVVMLVIGASMVSILQTSGQSVAYEVVGIRAYSAANSGVQIKLAEIFPLDNSAGLKCDGSDTSTATPSTSTINIDLSNSQGLQQCQTTISCEDFQHDNVTYYQITSVGQCEIGNDITSRTVVVEARSL